MMGFKNFFVRNKTLLLIVTLQLFLFLVVHRCHVKLFFFPLGQVHHEAYGVLLIDLSHFLLLECFRFCKFVQGSCLFCQSFKMSSVFLFFSFFFLSMKNV